MQRRDRFRLALKAFHRFAVGGRSVAQDFQSNTPFERDLLRLIHDPHAAATDFSNDAEVPQLAQRLGRWTHDRGLMDELDPRQALLKL